MLLDALCGLAVCRSHEGKRRFLKWLGDFDLSTAESMVALITRARAR